MPKKKSISKVKKKTPKNTKVKKKTKPIKKKVLKKIEEKKVIFKTKPEWIKSALVNKAFLHVIFNKEKFNALNCKTCFKNNIPGDFLTYANGLLVENKLINSLK